MELCHVSDLVQTYACIVSLYVTRNDDVGTFHEFKWIVFSKCT